MILEYPLCGDLDSLSISQLTNPPQESLSDCRRQDDAQLLTELVTITKSACHMCLLLILRPPPSEQNTEFAPPGNCGRGHSSLIMAPHSRSKKKLHHHQQEFPPPCICVLFCVRKFAVAHFRRALPKLTIIVAHIPSD